MSTNKNAQLRYQILDRCFSDFTHRYTIDEPCAGHGIIKVVFYSFGF